MKIFLSRDWPSESLLKHVEESGYQLIYFSCIEQHLITDKSPPDANWIFFYSPGAVRLYALNFEKQDYKFAALGRGTATAMKEAGITPGFIGDSSTPSEVVKEFQSLIGKDEKVVQARGTRSFERLREALPEESILDWAFYESLPKTYLPNRNADVYIFTSPSNAKAYLAAHELPPQSRIIAFGESTKKVLNQLANNSVFLTRKPLEKAVIDILERFASEP